MANGLARQVYIISDLHLGGVYADPASPNPEDRGFRICTQGEKVAEMVDALAAKPAGETRIELVINGDLVDFLAEREKDPPYWSPFTSMEDAAVAKLEAIVARDQALFDALGRLLDKGHGLTILLGNHDLELVFPKVRRRLEALLGILGRHDFRFIYDGEAYAVGDALIEHGNRYDSFNVVDHDALRRVRSLLSRNQKVPAEYAFEPPAGSRMVSTVINPIKEVYRFVDLLKPETGAVIPMLLALEPGYRNILSRVAGLVLAASKHKLASAAMPSFGGDIHAVGSEEDYGMDMGGGASFGSDISSGGSPVASDPLEKVLQEALGESPRAFLAQLEPEPTAYAIAGIGDDISTFSAIDNTLGLMQLLLAKRGNDITRRLPPLLKALRALQGDESFDRAVETAPEYLNAARELAKGGFKYVVFGHTHLAKRVDLGGGATYLNAGTWADLIKFPAEILSGSEAEALEKVRELVEELGAGRLKKWVRFKPTYVRLDLDGSDKVVEAELCDYTGPAGV